MALWCALQTILCREDLLYEEVRAKKMLIRDPGMYSRQRQESITIRTNQTAVKIASHDCACISSLRSRQRHQWTSPVLKFYMLNKLQRLAV